MSVILSNDLLMRVSISELKETEIYRLRLKHLIVLIIALRSIISQFQFHNSNFSNLIFLFFKSFCPVRIIPRKFKVSSSN